MSSADAGGTDTEGLVPCGTRVVVIRDAVHRPGVVTEVRLETHLRTYVVTCDDGSTAFASPYDIALESDLRRKPMGDRPEY